MNAKEIDIEAIGRIIVDTAIQVHKALGPGLLESVYQQCHTLELRARGLQVDNEVFLPIIYKSLRIEAGYRLDTLVECCVPIENKTVELLLPIHEAQLLTYLRLGNYRLGYLLNWNVKLMKYGIKRMVNNLPEPERPMEHNST